MAIKDQIADLLQANYEGLPLADRLSAASALGTLYHFVVDNDLEADYCARQPILAAADRLYTALLMSYVANESPDQTTRILLSQADLIFGLQALPNRRRADCFLAAAKKHLAACLPPQASPKASGSRPHSALRTPHSALEKLHDETAFRRLAYLSQTVGASLPQEVEAYLATIPEESSTAPAHAAISNKQSKINPAPSTTRFTALQKTIEKLEQEIQSSLFV